MENILPKAVLAVQKSQKAYCKFISANDAGQTKSHQSGFHISSSAWSMFFKREGRKGELKDVKIKIKWQDDFETDSRFIWYGQKTRHEYRLTRFQKGFPFKQDDNVGDLLVLALMDDSYYEAFVLSSDEDIEEFLATFRIPPSATNGLIPNVADDIDHNILSKLFRAYIKSLNVDFPESAKVSSKAREIYRKAFSVDAMQAKSNPDQEIVQWVNTEFKLFKAIENDRYGVTIKKPFSSVKKLIEFSNTILNRRKSRAGKSLENHLDEMFVLNALNFEQQVRTEGKRKPDFIFPGAKEYHSKTFNFEDLFFLAAKTTCKDRWRQILKEANKIPVKHLFTLQQGISSNQLEEMREENVRLVVPKEYMKSFPKQHLDIIMPLQKFINEVKRVQKL